MDKNSDAFVSCDWLCGLIASQMQMATDQVHPQMRLVSDLGIDSLELQSLLLAIDDALGVMPDGSQMQRVITVADLHAVLVRLVDAKGR
jgi:acyl carrier protein